MSQYMALGQMSSCNWVGYILSAPGSFPKWETETFWLCLNYPTLRIFQFYCVELAAFFHIDKMTLLQEPKINGNWK